LVFDCQFPRRLLNQIPHAPRPERDEFTHVRYSAVTCDPSQFCNDRYTLRPRLFARPRQIEMMIAVP
jgi:chitin synthase